MNTAPHQPSTEDRLLLAALRQGQAKAFEQLMRRYNRLLFRSARGIVRDDAEAQDAVQETYLRAFLALAGFRGDASLGTWLTRIVINQALSQQRKLGRVVLWNEDFSAGESEMPMDPTASTEVPTPEDEVARLQVRRRLQEALDLLPPIYRSVFMLRAVEGLGVEDTALALEVSQDVVKTRFLRARAMLRARLDFDPGSEAGALHQFAGRRCDDVVAAVLAQLRASGVIRDH
jgi:RNA polymerase sigma-70 factor (ECF subfamily)